MLYVERIFFPRLCIALFRLFFFLLFIFSLTFIVFTFHVLVFRSSIFSNGAFFDSSMTIPMDEKKTRSKSILFYRLCELLK